jgi:3-oxoacyl-(acyl-carrier-protein) synthase/3-hydroxymyristoyl/3-hydroxydecanoyl-(acyl carrier protein) dehydratase/1-acyl-sn-glycerol-3-phosphate acyltransferase
MTFEPIAIVGLGCVLPGALSPSALWDNVAHGRSALSRVRAGRWGLSSTRAMGTPSAHDDRTWSDVGGYVTSFDASDSPWDPRGFAMSADEILALDPIFHWAMHSGREALRDAGLDGRTSLASKLSSRAAVILGNLSFPTEAHARFAEDVWLAEQHASLSKLRAAASRGQPRPHPRNRFSSGLPAALTARALGLEGPAFCLDAACASSLYALEIACRKLQRREVDLALAGAVNRADDLFIHVGFCALSAMSRSGQSRPFHRDADGLVPAEGAAAIALVRLDDALASGIRVRAIIRGVGLSNDGRGRGLLAPSEEGQRRALRSAYEMAGISPAEVTLLECHATGTPVGDGAEVRSSAEVFRDAGARDVPIGSLKSNLGHLVTVAGGAAIIKVVSGMERGVRPPTLHADAPIEALDQTPFRLLREAEPWSGKKLAGVSAFGFGGNNAHALIESAEGASVRKPVFSSGVTLVSSVPAPTMAIVAIAARASSADRTELVRERALAGPPSTEPMVTVAVEMEGLKFPPKDLEHTLAQQLVALDVCREVARAVALPRERTAVLVGMGCDPEIARYGARWRMADWGRELSADEAWIADAQQAFVHKLEAAGVVGTMPNIPANRVSSQLDLGGPGFTIASEERSGLDALSVAIDALASNTVDAAIVGAVDLSHEPVHRAALAALGRTSLAGDAAVALVIVREETAVAQGLPVLARIEQHTQSSSPLAPSMIVGDGPDATVNPESLFGRAHAAHGLVSLAVALWTSAERRAPALVRIDGLEGVSSQWTVTAVDRERALAASTPAYKHPARRAAHPHTIKIPMATQSASNTQRMERAPALPPISNAPSVERAPSPQKPARNDAPAPVMAASVAGLGSVAPATASPSVAPTITAEPTVTSEVLSTTEALAYEEQWALDALPSDPVTTALLAQARIAAVQSDFLAQQAAVHRAFLQTIAAPPSLFVHAAQTQPVSDAGAIEPAPAVAVAGPAVARFEPQTPAPSMTPTAPTPPAATAPSAAPIAVVARPVSAPIAMVSAAKPVSKELPGPKYSRAQLEVLAGGRISEVFGPQFQEQDKYHRQVRMPEPPLLLADRVTGIDAVPLSMGTGTLWTETDVTRDAWYLTPEGRMPAGIMIESGQADLLLISWLGVDMLNKSERVYRLLGCEGSWHGELPKPGDTLVYDIHIDGHANQGDVRLFFFHYDCHVNGELRLRVRGGQAGFFTDEELSDSGGVLWSADDEKSDPAWRRDAPAKRCEKTSFSRDEILAFANRRPWECFGRGWELTRAHVRTPSFGPERIVFQHRVTALDHEGGPWKNGYLRAEQDVRPDDWFFSGHFKNDPCMPGTLMFEGCLQMMAFYLGSLGYTIERDGWRFEPARDEKYLMRCRGQVTPKSKQVVYELFIREVISGPVPKLVADLLCTVDGLKAFHARRVGLELIPDWPLADWKALGPHTEQETGTPVALARLGGMQGWREPKPVASVDGFDFDYASLLACAWGQPSTAFGPFYQRFDGVRRVARLPGPPYHFMSRVTKVDDGAGGHGMGALKTGTSIEVEYDPPESVWYLEQNGARTMPFCVLMEAALQPCGWLASYIGSALSTDIDLLFRNLDGTGTLFEDIVPEHGTLTTRARLDSISQMAGMIIESFTVQCFQQGRRVYEMKTVFGFFPKEAFENQVGLPVGDAERARFELPATSVIELDREKPARYFVGDKSKPTLADPMLLMIDRVVRWEPDGGAKGLGYARAEKDVDPSEWFFKAHFFQDPVQPGSLGIEAFCQLLQWAMLEKGIGADIPDGRFEPVMTGKPVTWKYRGQVVPKNEKISSEVEITEVGRDDKGAYAIADCSLWVDGKKIYQGKNLGIRVVSGSPEVPVPPPSGRRAAPSNSAGAHGASSATATAAAGEGSLSLASDPWLGDHRPTWTIAALPMMSAIDQLAAEAQRVTGRIVTSVQNAHMKRWVTVPDGETVRTRVEAHGDPSALSCALSVWREASDPRLSRFEPASTATVHTADTWPAAPAPLAPIADGQDDGDPYERGALFHGPSFRAVTRLRTGATGATAELDLARCTVPYGALNQGVLDALTHAIPHDALHRWSSAIGADVVAYPHRVERLDLFAKIPTTGRARVEARFAGVEGAEGSDTREPRFVAIDLQLVLEATNAVLASARLVEVLLPKGPIGQAPRDHRVAFLRDRRWIPSVSLSREVDGVSLLDRVDAASSDWLPNNLATIYAVSAGRRAHLHEEIACKEHASRRAFVHPARITVLDGDSPEPSLAPLTSAATHHAVADVRPLRAHPMRVDQDELGRIRVRDAGPSRLDLAPIRRYWDRWFGVGHWFGEDLHYGLVHKFVGDVVVTDPSSFAKLRGRSCLFLANHQVAVESLLFSVLAAGLTEQPVVTLAKAEHRESWLGHFIEHVFKHPGIRDPRLITFFAREDREALLEIVGELAQELASGARSVMVHVEGTRALSCRTPVLKMSSAFIDMALTVRVPIVPVRFVGGLPAEPPLETRLEFPVGYSKQDYWFGRAIFPEELEALPYKERKALVIDAINGLGPGAEREQPYPAEPEFERTVRAWSERSGATHEHSAILAATLGHSRSAETEALARALREGAYRAESGPKGEWMQKWARWFFGNG